MTRGPYAESLLLWPCFLNYKFMHFYNLLFSLDDSVFNPRNRVTDVDISAEILALAGEVFPFTVMWWAIRRMNTRAFTDRPVVRKGQFVQNLCIHPIFIYLKLQNALKTHPRCFIYEKLLFKKHLWKIGFFSKDPIFSVLYSSANTMLVLRIRAIKMC